MITEDCLNDLCEFIRICVKRFCKQKVVIEIKDDTRSVICAAVLVRAVGAQNVVGVCTSDKNSLEPKRFQHLCTIAGVTEKVCIDRNPPEPRSVSVSRTVFGREYTGNLELDDHCRSIVEQISKLADIYGVVESYVGALVSAIDRDSLLVATQDYPIQAMADVMPFGAMHLSEVLQLQKLLGIPDEACTITADSIIPGLEVATFHAVERFSDTPEFQVATISDEGPDALDGLLYERPMFPISDKFDVVNLSKLPDIDISGLVEIITVYDKHRHIPESLDIPMYDINYWNARKSLEKTFGKTLRDTGIYDVEYIDKLVNTKGE